MDHAAPGAPGGPLARRRLPLSVVAKPTGAACNLDCQYCFFLSKELLYDVPRQLMREETLRTYVAEYLAASGDGEVTMLWQGGEPTLRGLPFYREVVRLCEVYRRPGQKVVHALQTNGTLIDRQWADFLAENDFLVGVSLDGPPALHDVYRVNKGGRGTYALVRRGWDILQEAGVRTNVLCTVHHANEAHPLEVYRHFRDDLGARYLQFIPIVERVNAADLARAELGWGRRRPAPRRAGGTGAGSTGGTGAGGTRPGGPGGPEHSPGGPGGPGGPEPLVPLMYQQCGDAVTSRSVTPQGYGDFLTAVFQEWVAHDVGDVFVQDVDSALSALFGIYPTCVHAPECGVNLALEFNGDVYACDHWVEPDWLLGNVADASFATLAATPRMRDFSAKKRAQLPAGCLRCPVLPLCHGGCPKDRFVRTADGEGMNYLCPGYRAFYTRILPDLRTMARLIQIGRAPAEIMTLRQRSRPDRAERLALSTQEH